MFCGLVSEPHLWWDLSPGQRCCLSRSLLLSKNLMLQLLYLVTIATRQFRGFGEKSPYKEKKAPLLMMCHIKLLQILFQALFKPPSQPVLHVLNHVHRKRPNVGLHWVHMYVGIYKNTKHTPICDAISDFWVETGTPCSLPHFGTMGTNFVSVHPNFKDNFSHYLMSKFIIV